MQELKNKKTKAFDYTRSVYYYTKLGLSGYIGILMSLVESALIIYNFGIAKFIKGAHPLLFLGFVASCVIMSFLVGVLVTKSFFKKDLNSIYGKELQISSERNPYVNTILGGVAALGFDSSIANTKAYIEICKKLKIPTKELEEMLIKLKDMRSKAVIPK